MICEKIGNKKMVTDPTTIWVDKSVKEKLVTIAGRLQESRKQKITLNETILHLIEIYEKEKKEE